MKKRQRYGSPYDLNSYIKKKTKITSTNPTVHHSSLYDLDAIATESVKYNAHAITCDDDDSVKTTDKFARKIDNIIWLDVKLTYFKSNGSYYTEGSFKVDAKCNMYQIIDIVHTLLYNKIYPGISSIIDKIILVEAPNHPNSYPHLISNPVNKEKNLPKELSKLINW